MSHMVCRRHYHDSEAPPRANKSVLVLKGTLRKRFYNERCRAGWSWQNNTAMFPLFHTLSVVFHSILKKWISKPLFSPVWGILQLKSSCIESWRWALIISPQFCHITVTCCGLLSPNVITCPAALTSDGSPKPSYLSWILRWFVFYLYLVFPLFCLPLFQKLFTVLKMISRLRKCNTFIEMLNIIMYI